jgi:hypothetical protein
VSAPTDLSSKLLRGGGGGGLTDYTVNPRRAIITNSNTSDILNGVSGPSWEIHTYSSEGGPFSTTISCLCPLAFFIYFGVLSDYYLALGFCIAS